MLSTEETDVKKNDMSASSEAEKGVSVTDVGDAPPSIDLHPDFGGTPASNEDEETAAAPSPAPAAAATIALSLSTNPDRPTFHVMPRSSWINDPNGLCFHRGRFHAFFQHLEKEGSSDWDWAMAWGHASTRDLALWRREPVALRPTTGVRSADGEEKAKAATTAAEAEAKSSAAASLATLVVSSAASSGSDAAGCWSGCLVAPSPRHAREGMRPTLLYTGVVLRKDHHRQGGGGGGEQKEIAATSSSSSRPPRRHHHHHSLRPHAPPPPLPVLADLGLEMIERQLVAVLSDEKDERLTRFEKKGVFIPHAPFQLPSKSSASASASVSAASKSKPSSSPPASPSSPPSSTSYFYRYDSGFRDPFVYQRHDASKGNPWRLLIGSGKRRVESKKKRSDGPVAADDDSESTTSSDSEDEAAKAFPAAGTLLRYSCDSADLALGPWKYDNFFPVFSVPPGKPGPFFVSERGLSHFSSRFCTEATPL